MLINTHLPSSENPDSWHHSSMKIRTTTAIVVSVLTTLASPAGAFVCPRLETGIDRAMTGWQVPGLAIGIVQNDKIVYRGTFGVRDTDTGVNVTAKTVFATGSITKSLTALGAAIAATEGKIGLDHPVRRILAYFPKGISLRHLLSQSAGWPRHDALWYLDRYSQHELPQMLSLLPRLTPGGQTFQYNNVPFAAAGIALAHATGASWNDWVKAKILTPAGMTGAVTTLSGFRNTTDRASPYFPSDTGRITLPLRDTDPVAPAAGLYAHLDDMLRYVELLAHDGIVGGHRVVPAAPVESLRQPVTAGYGMGLRLGEWHGEELAFHPGFVDGYGARLSILPHRRTGVIVLSNMSGDTPVSRIVSQIALDCLTGSLPTDWVAYFGHRRRSPAAKSPPPAPAGIDRPRIAYSGGFDHPAYGRFEFAPVPGSAQLSAKFHGREIILDYAGKDRWRLVETRWPLREGLIFAFSSLKRGKFTLLATPLADGPTYRHNAGPIRFVRTDLPSRRNNPN